MALLCVLFSQQMLASCKIPPSHGPHGCSVPVSAEVLSCPVFPLAAQMRALPELSYQILYCGHSRLQESSGPLILSESFTPVLLHLLPASTPAQAGFWIPPISQAARQRRALPPTAPATLSASPTRVPLGVGLN